MNPSLRLPPWLPLVALGLALLAGCEPDQRTKTRQGLATPEGDSGSPAPKDAGSAPDAKKVLLGKNVWLETQGDKRRILISAEVCLREGQYGLECLLCKQYTKEHESILAMDADAKVIHAGLIAAGAKPGSPVKFDPKFTPPSGTPIRVTLQYEDKGKLKVVPAQQWVRDQKTKKDLEYDWVFAGSVFFKSPLDEDGPEQYAAAGEGSAICVTNVPTAMLDLPINSPKGLETRVYEPNTERIPAVGTKVVVILEPLPEKKEMPRDE